MAESSEGVAADELRAFIERIERLEEEKAGIAGDIKEVFAELKGCGFDAKAVRTIVRMRKQDHAERQEQEAILELYMQALGMLADTPLGRAAAGAKFGEEQVERLARRAAARPSVQEAVKSLGTPSPLTDEERAKGTVAAFVGKNGTRCSIQFPERAAASEGIGRPVAPTLEESEAMVAGAHPGVLKGTTIRLDHFEPSARRDALKALALSKGASVIIDGGEVVEPERVKRRRKTLDEKIAERIAAVKQGPPEKRRRRPVAPVTHEAASA